MYIHSNLYVNKVQFNNKKKSTKYQSRFVLLVSAQAQSNSKQKMVQVFAVDQA